MRYLGGSQLHPLFANLDTHFVCECKNEAASVTARELGSLKSLAQNKTESTVAIMFSRMGLTGQNAGRAARGLQREFARHERYFILNMTWDDLIKVVRQDYNLLALITEKYISLRVDADKDVQFPA